MPTFFLDSNFCPSNMVELLRWRALRQPDLEAYTFLTDENLDSTGKDSEGVGRTYGELDRQARAIGAWLQSIGESGERALLLYPSGLDYITAFFGALYAGDTAVPVYPPQSLQTLQHLRAIAKDAEASLILTTASFRARLEPLLAHAPELQNLRWLNTDNVAVGLENDWREPDVSRDSLALLQYTSGTTGSPKGVMLTHHNLLSSFRLIAYNYGFTSETRQLTWIPIFHNAGLWSGVLQPLYCGYVSILMSPVSFLQSPPRWLRAISRHKITSSGGPNFTYDLCVRHATSELLATLDLSSLDTAFASSEHIRPESLNRFAETFKSCGFRREAFLSAYGLTEASLVVSSGFQSAPKTVLTTALENNRVVETTTANENAKSLVSCGLILREQKVLIVNPETLTECLPDQIGEIWVSGPSIAQGYWRRPVETESTFRAFIADTGEGPFLRTGDLGFLQDRELFVTGRLKELIIIRGHNHYPQDIEMTVEQCHPALQQGGGAAFSVEVGDEERLVIVQEVNQSEEVKFDTLIELIRQVIAQEHGIQVYAVQLVKEGRIPRTDSHKIQRNACRVEFLAGSMEFLEAWQSDTNSKSEPSVSPQTEHLDSVEAIEAWLTALMAVKLGVDSSRIDKAQPITRYGLDSLGAIELTHAIEANYNISLPMWILLQGPSIRYLVAQITEQRDNGSCPTRPVIASAENTADEYPLSRGQQSLWFLHQVAPESAAYNVAGAVRIHAELDVPALRRSFQVMADRHASLRTTFTASHGKPIQRVHEQMNIFFQEEDAATWSEEFLKDRLTELAHRPFNLEQGPLLRLFLFRQSARQHILLCVMHHIITDLWSQAVLMDELRALYTAQAGGNSANLTPVMLKYSDFVRWQGEMLESVEGERLWDYWRKQIGGELPALNLLTDRPRPPVQTYRGASHFFNLAAGMTAGLKSVGQNNGATLYMTLLAAFQLLLHRYTGQQDILVGSITAGRSRAGMAGLVGYLVNPLVLRADFSQDQTFTEFLGQVRQTVLEAFRHEDYPFTLLVERLQPERDPSRTPLFQVMFILQQAPFLNEEGLPSFALGEPGVRMKLGDLTLESLALGQRTAQFDLTLKMAETGDGLAASFEYNTDLFDAATIERLTCHFQTLLHALVTDPNCSIAVLPLSSEPEQQLLAEWNQTSTRYSAEACLHQLFEAQVERTPEAVALVYEDKQLSYRDLNRRANQLAHYLRRLGIGPDRLVGILCERSVEMIVGLLGTLKAGGAYLPLDPTYPRERLRFMLEDAQVRVLLTHQRLVEEWAVEESAAEVVRLDADRELIGKESEENPANETRAENLAYVIYTSGSTGRPKGVAITHRSAVATAAWARTIFRPEHLSGVLASTSICFDLSVYEIFFTLSAGGTMVLAENALELPLLAAKNSVTLINTVPSAMAELLRGGGVPASVRVVNLAGEPLPNWLVQQTYEQTNATEVWNLYGPSEDTTYSTFALIERGAGGQPTIGRPIANTQVYLLDRNLRAVPLGAAGELYLGGEGLARCYLNRPALTAERFIPDPFSDRPGARIYRTGDLARYLPDGRIEFLGRVDNQVKIRGFRIELGEIEAALNQHPSVRGNIVIADESPIGHKRLVDYVVFEPDQTFSITELRNFLRNKLPEYMIPGTFVRLETLPLTPSGKVDRRALPVPDDSRLETEGPLTAPRTPIEEVVAGIWTEVLGLGQVGIHENFFDLGGHSLLAIQLISRVRETLHVELPVRSVFESPTVATLTEAVAVALNAEQPLPMPPIKQALRNTEMPLSYAQQRLWFLGQLETDFHPYNMPGAVRLSGRLNVDALTRSLNEVVRRHEILRTTFVTRRDQPWQVIAPTPDTSLPITDLRELSRAASEDIVQRLISDEAQRPFDLAEGPLFRTALLKLGEEDHVMLLTMHHIISDGWSMGVLIREVISLYQAYSQGEDPLLAALPIQYADFAVWQQQSMQGPAMQAQLSYWRQQLQNSPLLLELPTDYSRPAIQSFRGANLPLAFPESLSKALKALSRQEGVTLFMTLLAAFYALLNRYTGQEDINVGTPIAGRTQVEVESLIGCFVNTLVLRGDLTGDPTFAELLGRVREMALAAYAHQDLPFEKLVEELQPQRNLNRTPLFQVMFVMQNAPITELKLPGLELTPLEVSHQTAKFDLTLSLEESAQGLSGSLQYNTDLFDRESIARMGAHFRTLLQGVVDNPKQRLSSLPLLTDEEQQNLLVKWDDAVSVAQASVAEMFEAQVERTPDAIAVVSEDKQLSYRDLNRRANQLAHYLRRLGIGPDRLVGILCERSVEMIVGLLGILKAGGAYLPLDPTYPRERLRFMSEDAGISVLLTQESLRAVLPEHGAEVVCLDAEWELIGKESEENPQSGVRAENLAYVIYTSGSTGRPKGVMIQHDSAANLRAALHERIYWQQPVPLQVSVNAPLAFDSSVKQWLQLLSGHTLHIIPEELRLDACGLVSYLAHNRLDVLDCTPSQLKLLLDAGLLTGEGHHLKLLLVGGEAIDQASWQELAANTLTRCYNVYGPTECTVDATVGEVWSSAERPSIGRPLANTQVYLLDRQLRPVPIGVPAQMYIGGAGVGRGYLKRPAVTAAQFIPHPFSREPGARLYRTGDVARHLPTGEMEFLGRVDEQVKVRGFRIELGEVEAALKEHAQVQDSVVVACGGAGGEQRLVAYVIVREEVGVSTTELRSFLKQRLPDFMIPSAFVQLESWPLTPNGKVNRQLLLMPDQTRPQQAIEFVAPRTADEKTLAAIWTDLLGFEQVGVHDNFFESGGHSLLATQLVSRVRTTFQLELPLRAVFESPNIAALVENIETIRWAMEGQAESAAVSHGQRETGEL